MIQIQNLTKIYNKKPALDNINLELHTGKIYGILGRNGAGKTTLVNIITNRALATGGKVLVDGHNSYENDFAQENIFCITEKSAYPKTERASALFTWANKFYPKFDIEYAHQLAQMFDLELEKKLGKLSTGYTTIVKAILTLASNAKYMFFDEPVLGIDAIYREVFYQELKKTHQRLKNCMILATHILDEAENIVDDVVILKNGRVAFNDQISKVLHKQNLQDFYLEINKNQIDKVATHNLAKRDLSSGKSDIKKIKNSIAYIFRVSWVQFLVVIGVLASFAILSLALPSVSFSVEITLWINIFIAGLVIHGTYFSYALYNGVSRKTYFYGLISMVLAGSLSISLVATAAFEIINRQGTEANIITALYGSMSIFNVYVWFVTTCIFFMALALFALVLFQALSRKGRYIAMTIFIGITTLFTIWGNLAPSSLGNIFLFILGIKYDLGVWFLIMWLTVVSAIFITVAWLLLKRTEIK